MLREIFSGGPEVQEARTIIANLQPVSDLSNSQLQDLKTAHRITRRHALRLIAYGTGATIVATSGAGFLFYERFSDAASILPEIPINAIPVDAKPAKGIEKVDKQDFDLGYLMALLSQLKEPADENKRQTLKSLEENTVLVMLLNAGEAGKDAAGTATRIDQSGYFLTAAHLVRERDSESSPIKSPVQIYSPHEGKIWQATSMIFDPDTDLAILYAPSGKDQKSVPGIRISDDPLAPNEKLWLMGLNTHATPGSINIDLVIPFGKIDPIRTRIKNFQNQKTYDIVWGMRPYGGSSGGAIIDSEGRIVGVESGAIESANLSNNRKNSTHALISPLENLPKLLSTDVRHLQSSS